MSSDTAPVSDRTLSAGLVMDAVSLRVGDLGTMSSYYENALALVPIEERPIGREVHRVLGRGSIPMVRLVHTPDLPEVNPRDAGLFHTAFLFDDAASLAATVYRAAQDPRSRFSGSSDHLVSEAFYFTDPEGNGIELYVDRPREAWSYENGELQMDTRYLDPNAYLAAHLDEAVLASAERQSGSVGHVHLQVGDVARARDFYVEALGFEATVAGYPGALFAGPRAARLGLGDVAIALPAREDLDALAARLRDRGIVFADTGRSIVVDDPWGTQVTLSLPAATAEELLAGDR
jgi:catechol 2,3-dioxygenase